MRVKIPEWLKPEKQTIDDNRFIYNISSLIFQARNLEPFEIDLKALRVDYGLLNKDDGLIEFVSHMNAVMKADLTKPIILDTDGWCLDGRHRITKALYEGRDTILAVRFEEKPEHVGAVENG